MTGITELPYSINVSAEEMSRLEDFASRHEVVFVRNKHMNVLPTSLDNWWAFILLAKWRAEQPGLALQDLIDAPIGAVVVSADERTVRKTEDGWVLFFEGHEPDPAFPPASSQQLMNIRPIRFEE